MNLTIHLASERIYAYKNENGSLVKVKGKKQDYFDSFARYNHQDATTCISISEKTRYYKNALMYPMYNICSNSSNDLFIKLKSMYPIPLNLSPEGSLVYMTEEGSVQPETVLKGLLEDIILKAEGNDKEVQSLSVIIPDFYDQSKRTTLRDILFSIKEIPIQFINESSAGVAYLTKQLSATNTIRTVVLRFDSGVFEVSVFKDVNSSSATPVITMSNDRIGGVDLVTKSYELFTHFQKSRGLAIDLESEKECGSKNWINILYCILDDEMYDDTIPDIYYMVNKRARGIEYDPSYNKRAIEQIRASIVDTIETCLTLSGFQPSDISYVVSTGPWSRCVSMKEIVESIFPRCSFKEVNDDLLCKAAGELFSEKSKTIVKQCLQTSWGIRFKEKQLLLLDRFVPYPCSVTGLFNFIPTDDDLERWLALYMVPLSNSKQIDMKQYNVTQCSSPGTSKVVRVDLTIDKNGIIAVTIFSDVNGRQRIWFVCSYNFSPIQIHGNCCK